MTKEELYQAIAEKEGWVWVDDVRFTGDHSHWAKSGCSLLTEGFNTWEFAGPLIEKYKLEPSWNEDGSVSIFEFLPQRKLSRDKDLITAVFTAVLAIGGE